MQHNGARARAAHSVEDVHQVRAGGLQIEQHRRRSRGGRGVYVCTISRETFMECFVANEAVEPYEERAAIYLSTLTYEASRSTTAMYRLYQKAGNKP